MLTGIFAHAQIDSSTVDSVLLKQSAIDTFW
jgi:hypothetical protein